jgi:hypothetical protein
LECVLGIRGRTEEPSAHAEDRGPVAPDQFRERVLIAIAEEGRNQSSINPQVGRGHGQACKGASGSNRHWLASVRRDLDV